MEKKLKRTHKKGKDIPSSRIGRISITTVFSLLKAIYKFSVISKQQQQQTMTLFTGIGKTILKCV
jgi:hypothetical protein